MLSLGFYVKDIAPIIRHEHLVRNQALLAYKFNKPSISYDECDASKLNTWLRKVLAPVQAGFRDFQQNIPQLREECLGIRLVVRPPVGIVSHHVLLV